MAAEIQPLVPDRVKEWARLQLDAFKDNPANAAMLPNGNTQTTMDYVVEHTTKALAEPKTAHHLVVLDPATGDVAALAKWVYHEAGKDTTDAYAFDPSREWPADGNHDAHNYFFGAMNASLAQVIDDRKHWCLVLLATSVKYGRRGYGTKLVQWGTARADADGVECLVDATEAGRPLYEKCGFMPMIRNEYDLTPFGVSERGVTTAMLRAPGAK